MRVQAVSATPRLLRAIAIAVTVAFAFAFGLNLSHGYWMPIAAIVAMKASLNQTTIAAAQRVAGLLAKRTAKAPPQPATQPA